MDKLGKACLQGRSCTVAPAGEPAWLLGDELVHSQGRSGKGLEVSSTVVVVAIVQSCQVVCNLKPAWPQGSMAPAWALLQLSHSDGAIFPARILPDGLSPAACSDQACTGTQRLTQRFLLAAGEGEFGIVHKAMWHGTLVAAKILKVSSAIALGDFRSELEVLRKVHHPNAVQFLGACTRQEPYVLVTGGFSSAMSRGMSKARGIPAACTGPGCLHAAGALGACL